MTTSKKLERSAAAGQGDLEAQLVSLYEDRERLHRELGTADPDQIVAMVRSLEAQLLELYEDKARRFTADPRDDER